MYQQIYSIKSQCWPDIETTQFISCINQLSGFYMRATLAFNLLSNLKSKIDKLVSILADLSKLSDVVKTNVVKKDAYNIKFKNIEDKISDINNLATFPALNSKIN